MNNNSNNKSPLPRGGGLGWGYLLLFFTLLLTACGEQRVWRIGVSQCSDDDWRTKMNDEIRREALFHDNIEVEIRSADDNSQRQIDDIRYFADNGFDIIVCAPNEADALTPIIKEVYESGKPVLLFDRNINGDTYTAWQGADNAEIGENAAMMAWSMAGDTARIVCICGLEGSTPTIERRTGFNRKAKELGMTILGGGHGNWIAEDAARAADSLLRLYPQANVIYAQNDRMAIAAAEVARKLGRGNVRVIGIDATPNIGIPAVDEGLIDATFFYPTDGYRLVHTALDILEGRTYERHHVLPTPSAVDKTNAHILLMQYQKMREETERIEWLQSRIDVYWQQYSMQKAVLYSVLVIMLLLVVILFITLRNHRISKERKREIELQRDAIASQRDTLAAQRDELSTLYTKLQEATTSKLSFFTNVSHDLRTPLTLIADPVQQMTAATNLTPQQHTLMELAHKNVKRLMRLINQILDIRKFDNGQLALNLTTADLAAAMREWMTAFALAAKKNHIRLVVDIAEGEDFTTAIDMEKIERVLFNLMSNAFKFTPQNGMIKVTLRTDTTGIVLTVSDTGRGIPADQIQRVFDQFFHTDEINPHGSGIGLALSKIFVDMHGGTITVESEEDKGTTFTVTLPKTQAETATAAIGITDGIDAKVIDSTDEIIDIPDGEIPVSETAPTVLIIDDNPDICTLVRTTLGSDFAVAQALSGAQGIRLATKHVPDLIICDVMMPGIDGYETCRRLKAEPITCHIPILMLTAAATDDQRTESYECGADGYMSKPFDHAMLLARVKNMIENRRTLTPALSLKGEGADNIPSSDERTIKKSPSLCGEGWGGIGSIDPFLSHFYQIVEKHLSDSEFSVEDIADEIGLSRVQLYRKLKALTNYSPTDLQRIARLKRGERLLKTTTQTISEIAYSVGFSSPSYFTKCYRDYFGESPSDVQARTSKIRINP